MAGCHSEDTTSLRTLTTPTRNNYFYGKLLDEHHFTLEQRYFNNKRWLMNRVSLGSGVLCGLELSVINGALALSPGVAVDILGREIIVPRSVTPIDVRQLTDACGKPAGAVTTAAVTVCLAFHPCAGEMAPVLVADCDTRDGCAPGTISEQFAVLVQANATAAAAPGCTSATLFASTTVTDFYNQLLTMSSAACPDPGADDCVVLGSITVPANNDPLTAADIGLAGRRVAPSNALLFQLILCLWEKLENPNP